MMNPRSFSIPTLTPLSLFQTSTVPQFANTHRPTARPTPDLNNTRQTSTRLKATSRQQQRSGIKTINNMCEEVDWFNQINTYQAIIKIGIVWVLCMALYMLGVCSIQIFLCVSVLSFFLLGLAHNMFGSGTIQKWAQASLVGTIFVLCNQLTIKVLNAISNRVAQILYYSHFTLIPALITTCVLWVTYIYRPLLLSHKQRQMKSCIKHYFVSLSNLLIRICNICMILLQTYAVVFLLMYVLVANWYFQQISTNGASYISILHPVVFMAQIVVYLIVIVLVHGLVYFVHQPVFWALVPRLYTAVNQYTKIPIILQLLTVTSSQQITKQLSKQGLLPSFNIFSYEKSRRSNQLNQNKRYNIYKHALAYIINLLTNKTNKINTAISLYSSINSVSITQPKYNTSYWDILSQFFNTELDRCLLKLYDMHRLIQYVHIAKSQNKTVYSDLLYLPRMKMLEIQLWNKEIQAARHINLTDYILEILSMSNINLGLEVGCSANILTKVKQINHMADQICGVFWLNDIVTQKIMKLHTKTSRIIDKSQ